MLFPRRVDLDEAAIKRLIKLYEQSYRDLRAMLLNASDFTVARNAQLMAQITAQLQYLGNQTDQWINTEIPKQYQKGVDDLVKQMKHLGIPLAQAEMNLINHQSVRAIVSDAANKFGTSLTTIQRSVDSVISAGVRQQIQQRIAQGALTGDTRKAVTAAVKQSLQDEGIFALRDAGGKKWALNTYAEMLARTKMVEARNTGLSDMMQQNGYSLVEVSAHGAEDVCGPWEGEILDVTPGGSDSGYPSLEEAIDSGLFHPNCQHSINAISDPNLAERTYKYDSSTGSYTTTVVGYTDDES
jgi:transposase